MESPSDSQIASDVSPSKPSGSTWGLFALALFALSAGLRLLYVWLLRDHPRFDAPAMDAGYHLAWAQALADGVEFREGPLFRAPLYPMALAAMLKVTGGSLLGVRVLQALLGGLTAVLTYRLGARTAGDGAGRIAGVLVAISWPLVAFDAELLIPVLLLPLLLLALDRAACWLEGSDESARALGSLGSPRASVVLGVLFGLAAIARPNVLLFMPVLFGLAVVRSRRLGPGLLLAVGTLLPILPVTVHNALEGDASLIATQGGVNFWIGNNPASDGAAAIVPGTRDGWWEGYFDAVAQAEFAEGRELKATEVSAHYRDRAFDWFQEDPGAALAHFAWKARLLAANVEIANNQDMRFTAFRTLPVLRWSPARWGVLLGLGCVGLALLVRQRRSAGVLLVGFTLVYALSIVLFFVNARFRLPLVPVLAIGSGAALAGVLEAARARRWPTVAALFAPALLIGGLSFVAPRGIVESDANGLAELGRAELARGDAEAALRFLEEAIRANDASVQVRMALASALVEAGRDPERALNLLEEAKALPRGKDLRAELDVQILDTQLSAGQVQEALSGVRRALLREPKNGALRFVNARAEAKSGQPRRAVQLFEELLADEPTNVAVALNIASIQEQLGLRDEARRAYERVLGLASFASPAYLAAAREGLARLSSPR